VGEGWGSAERAASPGGPRPEKRGKNQTDLRVSQEGQDRDKSRSTKNKTQEIGRTTKSKRKKEVTRWQPISSTREGAKGAEDVGEMKRSGYRGGANTGAPNRCV